MKPIRLIFGGIGPYRHDVDIDFAALDELGLFVIAGETGAGKTTIFDAMTYALYGKLANGRRTKLLVSDHPGAVAPHVEFTFDLGPRRFQVRRTLSTATRNARPGDQVLDEYTGDQVTRSITKDGEVTARIADLIGLDADQFFQVVMIPQNQFREFLIAGDKEKEELLRALFGTGLYQNIAGMLELRASEMKQRIEQANMDLESQRRLARKTVDDLPRLPAFDGLPDVDDDLATVIDRVDTVHSELAHEAKLRAEEANSATEAHAKADTESARFDAAKELGAERAADAKAAKSVETATKRLDDDTRASIVVDPEAQSRSADESARKAVTEVDQARKAVERLLARAITKSPVLSFASQPEIGSKPSDILRRIETSRARLTESEELHETIDELESDIAEARSAAKETTKEIQIARPRLDGHRKTVVAFEKERKELRSKTRNLAQLSKKVDDLDDLLDRADVDSAIRLMNQADADFKKANAHLAKADTAYQVALDRHTRHLAGELAADLEDGEPCPVCGSTEHPTPAGGAAAPGDDVETSNRRLQQATHARGAAERILKDSQNDVDEAKKIVKSLPAKADQSRLRNELAAAEAAATRLDGVEEELEQALELREEMSDQVANLESEAKAREAEIRRIEKELTKARGRMPALAARKDIEPATEWCDAIEDAASGLVDALADAQRASSSAKTAAQALAKAVARSGYSTAAEALRHVLADEQRSSAREFLDLAKKRTDRINGLVARVGSEPVPARRPDVDRLLTQREKARAMAKNATELASEVKASLRTLKTAAKEIGRIGKEVTKLSATADSCAHAARIIARGDVATERLSLERWVQRSFFETVCAVATARLVELSHGRYRLTLEADGAVHAKRTRGLSLFVTDSYTGRNRAVQTLSGGEQFLTSLALALALAEVVQQQAGGVDLGALFIDEGFGSLDGDSLDTAVEVLRNLQGTGRMIGVISHVESMQSELPIGLRVEKSAAGSRVKDGAATE